MRWDEVVVVVVVVVVIVVGTGCLFASVKGKWQVFSVILAPDNCANPINFVLSEEHSRR